MQHSMIEQEEQTCVLQEDRQSFIEEVRAMRSLAREAGVAGSLLAELEVFRNHVEHMDESAWERQEVRLLSRNELVHLSIAVLWAYRLRSC